MQNNNNPSRSENARNATASVALIGACSSMRYDRVLLAAPAWRQASGITSPDSLVDFSTRGSGARSILTLHTEHHRTNELWARSELFDRSLSHAAGGEPLIAKARAMCLTLIHKYPTVVARWDTDDQRSNNRPLVGCGVGMASRFIAAPIRYLTALCCCSNR